MMPGVITDTENTTFTQYGRQQINNFVKSSIRPYERRLARRFGFYDFRIDYDFSRANVHPVMMFFSTRFAGA